MIPQREEKRRKVKYIVPIGIKCFRKQTGKKSPIVAPPVVNFVTSIFLLYASCLPAAWIPLPGTPPPKVWANARWR